MHAVERDEVGGDPRRLRAQQLGGVGVLLLGHDRRARGEGVGDLAEAELLAGPQHDLGAQAREVRGAGGGGAQVVQDEVAVGDGVDRVLDHRVEAQRARHGGAVGGEVHAGQRAGAERQAVGRVGREGEAAARRARASRSTRAGGVRGRRAGRAAGGCSRASASRRGARRGRRARSGVRGRRPAPHARGRATYIATSVATWSLRERAVWSFPPTGPAISVSRRSIAMWMSSSSSRNGKLPSASSRSTASRPACSASRSSAPMIPASASIAACARDCATSCGHRRRSKDSDALSAWKAGSCGSEKRDTGAAV